MLSGTRRVAGTIRCCLVQGEWLDVVILVQGEWLDIVILVQGEWNSGKRRVA